MLLRFLQEHPLHFHMSLRSLGARRIRLGKKEKITATTPITTSNISISSAKDLDVQVPKEIDFTKRNIIIGIDEAGKGALIGPVRD